MIYLINLTKLFTAAEQHNNAVIFIAFLEFRVSL